MARMRVSRLPVLNRKRDLVGQFSVEDVVLRAESCPAVHAEPL
jgi:hypothetical protein